MPNEKNLVPNERRTPSERRKNAQKAGKASGEARRQRKTLKENMNLLLNLDVASTKDFNKLTAMGLNVEDIDNSMLLTAALFKRAVAGDVAAYREIRSLLGEGEENENGSLSDLIQGLQDD